MFSGENFTNQSNVLHEREKGGQLGEESSAESDTTVTSADQVKVDWTTAAISVGTVLLSLSQPSLATSFVRTTGTTTSEPTSADSVVAPKPHGETESWKTRRLELIDKKYDQRLNDREHEELRSLNNRIDRELADNFHEPNEKLEELEQLLAETDDTEES
jgi:hypothetical protein